MTPTTRITKRNIILAALLIGVLLLVRQLVWVLTTGKIAVITNGKSNIVTLRQVNSSAKQVRAGNTTFRVRGGSYIITVTSSQLSSQQVVNIKTRETKRVTINLKAAVAIGVEPASSREARSLIADTNAASFIDATNGNTYTVNQGGAETLVDSDHSFKFISWADTSYGIGKDKDGAIVSIINNQTQPLTLPAGFQTNSNATFALSPNRMLAISDGSTVYTANYGGGYTRAFTANKGYSVYVVDSQNGNTLLSETPAATNPSNHGDTDAVGKYILLDKTGSVSTRDNLAYESVLSPDGQHVAISGNGATSILDNHLKKVIDIPSPNVVSLVWSNNHTVLYTFNDRLWQYDMNSGRAIMLTDVSDKGPINIITPSRDGKFIYILVQRDDTSNGFSLFRINLVGQQPSSLMVKLGVFLPNVVDACSLGYENLTQPTVVVHGPADMQNDCTVSARNYLQQYNVSDTGLNIVFNPGA